LEGHTDIESRQDILALLFAADRIWHIKQYRYDRRDRSKKGIENAIRERNIVICNRYLLSSLAYQSGPPPPPSNENLGSIELSSRHSLEMSWVDFVNHPANSEKVIVEPDLVIFLDVPPEESMKRIIKGNRTYELYEDYGAAAEVYKRYQEAMEKYRKWTMVRIKGFQNGRARSIDSVQREIQEKVREFVLREEPRRERPQGREEQLLPEEKIDYHAAS
jgi:thymidylate kinase